MSNIVINQKLSGLIKDIYLISKPLNYPSLNYITEVESNYDNRYARGEYFSSTKLSAERCKH